MLVNIQALEESAYTFYMRQNYSWGLFTKKRER